MNHLNSKLMHLNRSSDNARKWWTLQLQSSSLRWSRNCCIRVQSLSIRRELLECLFENLVFAWISSIGPQKGVDVLRRQHIAYLISSNRSGIRRFVLWKEKHVIHRIVFFHSIINIDDLSINILFINFVRSSITDR